ncbi:MAG: HU family DNA-binding protein [Armatimonadetes bacterium]|nr:HU family DNA-binding protein [Armatimonadota bacterium]
MACGSGSVAVIPERLRTPHKSKGGTSVARSWNKADLVEAVANKTGLSKKDAGAALDAAVETITNALKNGDKVTLVGFGTFESRKRGERKAKNPRTGEEIIVAASNVPAFKAGKALKDAVK